MPDGAVSSGTVTIGVCGGTSRQSQFDVAPGRSVQINLPSEFSAEHVALASKDLEILLTLLSEKPNEMQQIVAAVSAGNFASAQELAKEIGLTESDFVDQGGGLLAVVIVIAIGCALLLEHD
jgi:hypothetical protein